MKKIILAVMIAAEVLFVGCVGKGDSPKARGAGTADTLTADTVAIVTADTAATFFTDSRDGKMYRAVKIGKQVWMAENLNYKTVDSKCYDNDTSYCTKYGRLYTWADAMNACPAGWHLPTNKEWEKLMTTVGSIKVEKGGEEDDYWSMGGKKLKSKADWDYNGNVTDEFAFSALPGGFGTSLGSSFRGIGYRGEWWSATTERGIPLVGYWYMYYSSENVVMNHDFKTHSLYSVRCVQD